MFTINSLQSVVLVNVSNQLYGRYNFYGILFLAFAQHSVKDVLRRFLAEKSIPAHATSVAKPSLPAEQCGHE